MKIVCYTCIVGAYDSLKLPLMMSNNIDYVCFTDQRFQIVGPWQLRNIPSDLQFLSNVKKQRIVKICPHRFLKNYDISIWIDGSISIIGDLNTFISQYDLKKNPFYVRIHPFRNCIYDEADVCMKMHKDVSYVIEKQINRYKEEGYPAHIGMVETGILLRRHNDIKCQMIDNMWATELLNFSHRDQLSFNYVCWKNHFLPGILRNEFKVNKNDIFKLNSHGL